MALLEQLITARGEEAREQVSASLTRASLHEIQRIRDGKRDKYERVVMREKAKDFLQKSGIYDYVQQVALLDDSHQYRMTVSEVKNLGCDIRFCFDWLISEGKRFDGDLFDEGVIVVNHIGNFQFNGGIKLNGEQIRITVSQKDLKKNPDILKDAFAEIYNCPNRTYGDAVRKDKRLNPNYKEPKAPVV
ncbi:MAG: hypothetical protein A2152_02175 [Candidatus Levybacteria bacterium RBG_16_35_6]|nr:MAG: hypothetical protein A2152_02175 [Candidatus Levybacteria bacterium RBG_16_35_6]